MSQGPPPTPPQQGLPPVSQPFPGSLTPGWNDPPSIQYNLQATNSVGRTKLNKRVPFPLQQGLPATTKPTAIVSPCQTTTLSATSSGSSNIAVVHPMQYPPSATVPFSALTTNTGATVTYTLPRESSQTPPPPSVTTTCASANVPTMPVAAVPRQTSNNESGIAATATTSSAIQHL